ncbi:hypothetical protein DASC09_032320 [Saccharomycopsis crataegensis]|uniref:Inhibitor I9 domain-containing protein n=1 Tax=Saccharomycopsis crataegensis TaxID=43959 RepID=A0AAV5QM89_9ASCO|nr:hypothetical protein DASC09_032320 [Saccharomycopsis crataegensis]
MKLSSIVFGATMVMGVLADDYIISFRNLNTPDSVYNKVKQNVVKKFKGKILNEYTIIKGFTASIPNVDVKVLDMNLNEEDSSYPIVVEKDSTVTIAE